MRNASFTYWIEHKTPIRIEANLTLIRVLQRLFRERLFRQVAGGRCPSCWPAPPGLPAAQDSSIFVLVDRWSRWGYV